MMREKEPLKLPLLNTQTTMSSTNDSYDTTNNYHDLFTTTPKLKASVPFKWEKAPGKPIIPSQPQITKIPSYAALELPPRLQTTTKTGSSEEEGEGYFGKLRRERGRRRGGVFGSWSGNKEVVGGSFVFPSDYGGDESGFKRVKRVRRNSSFSSLGDIKSHFWVNMYEGLKQVMPWRSKKLKKQGLKV